MTTSAPQKLGRYEVLEEIGKGAMGVVYLARDPLIGRQVALKTFRVGFSAKDQELQQFRSRFVREAQSAGILSHPNIVTIHDVIDEGGDGVCFIAMEFVKGTNLKQLMQKSEALGHDYVVQIVAQIAEALDYAHSRGVVHRDIKPANILITQDDKVKITDFGIARLDTSNLTMEGQLLGTPNYMAPEQIQGKDVDHRADIFSLGVVFYEMLTRRKPFQGENLTAVTHKIVYEPFTPPEEIVVGLPAAMGAVLRRCLEKDPNRRYPRAAEIAAELRKSQSRAATEDDDTSATQEVAGQTADRTVESAAPRTEPAGVDGSFVPKAPAGLSAPPAPPPPMPTALRAPAAGPAPAPVPASGPSSGAAASGAFASTSATRILPELTAMPAPAASPAAPSSGAISVSPAPLRIRKQRLVVYGIVAVAALAVLAIGLLWLTGRDSAAPAAVVSTAAEDAKRAAELALVEARRLIDRGDLQVALQALARAEAALPGDARTRALRVEVERVSRDLAVAAEREQRVTEALILAREEYAKRRFDQAIGAAESVLALVPDHPEAVKLKADSESALVRQKDRDRIGKAPAPSPGVVPSPSPPVVRAVTPVRPAVVEPAPVGDANLKVAFHSDASEGVLTIYAGERQIVREAFKFVRKTGFLRTEKISGELAFERTLPAGATPLRVYVSIPGKPTRSVMVEADLAGGSSPLLTVNVESDGRTTAGLR